MPNYDSVLCCMVIKLASSPWALHDGDESEMWSIIDASVSQENTSSLPINALTDTASFITGQNLLDLLSQRSAG